MSKHTAGPWEIRGTGSLRVIIGRHGDIAEIRTEKLPAVEWSGNAALIAAAPALAAENEGLKFLLSMIAERVRLDGYCVGFSANEAALIHSAIAKGGSA